AGRRAATPSGLRFPSDPPWTATLSQLQVGTAAPQNCEPDAHTTSAERPQKAGFGGFNPLVQEWQGGPAVANLSGFVHMSAEAVDSESSESSSGYEGGLRRPRTPFRRQ